MKTQVEMVCDDREYNEWVKGDKGYIDGYVQGGNGRPFLAVVIGERVVLCQTHQVKVLLTTTPTP